MRASFVRLVGLALAALWLAASPPLPPRSARAAEESPYRVVELAVQRGPGQQHDPLISGTRVVWQESGGPTGGVRGRDLATGQELAVFTQVGGWPLGFGGAGGTEGDTLVAAEVDAAGQYAIYAYSLRDGSRSVVAPARGDEGSSGRTAGRVAGETVVWIEGPWNAAQVFTASLRTREVRQLTAEPARRDSPAIAGSLVVWLDRRHVPADRYEADVYAYDLAGRREVRITAQPEAIGQPAVAGNVVVWPSWRSGVARIQGYDLARAVPVTLAELPADVPLPAGLDAAGDLVVWSARGEQDDDVFGYDLQLQRSFVISRAIGSQHRPRISGRTVVWTDARGAGVGRYESDADVFAAMLEPGPAAPPPRYGAPDSADARIQIVWPHGGAPVAAAARANVAAWLFLPGGLDLAPCQWSPRVQLWQSLDSQPARLVALGSKTAGRHSTPDRRSIPTWEFNDVDVSAARDPRRTLFFFLTVEGVPGRTNVWAHGADPRTYFPVQDVPTGLSPSAPAPGSPAPGSPNPSSPIEARIQIVWPHGGAPVERARLVNVSAILLQVGSLLSVPPDWAARVRLYRSLNAGLAEPVALGERRLTTSPHGLRYPVWDFNDVDVSAATDPANRYYFTLAVEGVQTLTNVWAHGVDARTYFPQPDVPTAACR